MVKCVFTAFAGGTTWDEVQPSDPLDLRSPYPAMPKELANQSCLFGNDFTTIKD